MRNLTNILGLGAGILSLGLVANSRAAEYTVFENHRVGGFDCRVEKKIRDGFIYTPKSVCIQYPNGCVAPGVVWQAQPAKIITHERHYIDWHYNGSLVHGAVNTTGCVVGEAVDLAGSALSCIGEGIKNIGNCLKPKCNPPCAPKSGSKTSTPVPLKSNNNLSTDGWRASRSF